MAKLGSSNIFGDLTVSRDTKIGGNLQLGGANGIFTLDKWLHLNRNTNYTVRVGHNSTANLSVANNLIVDGTISGNGSGLNSLNADNLSSGVVPSARLSGSYNISVSGSAGSVAWGSVTGKPSTFTPSSHNHSWANITSGVPVTATRWPTWSEVTSKPSTFTPSSHTHAYLPLAGGGLSGMVSTATNTTTFTSANDTTLSVRGNTTAPATMSFHRSGAYAVNFGLDTDNKLKVGGWSLGTNKYAIYHEGNKPSAADIGAAASSHNHSWANITSGVPATATRWPSWSEVTSKPSTFTPSSHTHTPAQVGLGNVSNAAQVTTAQNSSLNGDTRNSRGVTRLYRRDSNSDYSVQTHWDGRWFLRGYLGDTFHGECKVDYANNAGYANSAGGVSWANVWSKPATATRWPTLSEIGAAASSHSHSYLPLSGGTVTGHLRADAYVYFGSSTKAIFSASNHWYFRNYSNGANYYFQGQDSNGTNRALLYLQGGSRPYCRLYEYGAERLRTTSGGITVYNTGRATDWVATSDKRLKENIIPLDIHECLDKVSKLIPSSFTWKKSKKEDTGLIAQEVQEIIPERVDGDKELAISYAKLTTHLIGAVQALTKRIEELEGNKV